MYEEGVSFCAGPAAVAGAGKRGEGLLSSGLDAVTLGEQKKASLCRACSAAVLWEGGERTALLWQGGEQLCSGIGDAQFIHKPH